LALALSNLSGYLVEQGKYQEAKPTCARALQIIQKSFGNSNQFAQLCLNNLGLLLTKLERNQEIESIQKEWNVGVATERKALAKEAQTALLDHSEDLELLESEWRTTVPQMCTPPGMFLPPDFAAMMFDQVHK